MYSGPFQPGDKVQLTDAKRRHFTIELTPGGQFHSHKGIVNHDDITVSYTHLTLPTNREV